MNTLPLREYVVADIVFEYDQRVAKENLVPGTLERALKVAKNLAGNLDLAATDDELCAAAIALVAPE